MPGNNTRQLGMARKTPLQPQQQTLLDVHPLALFATTPGAAPTVVSACPLSNIDAC